MQESKQITFSIVVVALNPGEKLRKTLDSIVGQDYENYQVLIKDGMSKDGSEKIAGEMVQRDSRFRLVRQQDCSIYDAMNQAVEEVDGDFILFLNCGDTFYHKEVLKQTAECMEEWRKKCSGSGECGTTAVFFGHTFCEQTGDVVYSPPSITGFTCYRNIPCHQSCFYDSRLFQERGYREEYRIRADYEHFLWCFYRKKTQMIPMDTVVAAYEGGGYSESLENKKRDREEHKEITRMYMSKGELFRYRSIMILTLSPLRSWMAENKRLSGLYHGLKKMVYQKK